MMRLFRIQFGSENQFHTLQRTECKRLFTVLSTLETKKSNTIEEERSGGRWIMMEADVGEGSSDGGRRWVIEAEGEEER